MGVIYEYRELLFAGTMVTIYLAVLSLVLAVMLGLLGAGAKLSSNLLANGLASSYTTLIRGVPDLVLILLVYYGSQTMLNQLGESTGLWDYVEVPQFTAGVGTLGFIYGAYMTETFRGAILAIPAGQTEAGIAVGMNNWTLFRRITWPQMIRYALPGFTNNWLVLLKATALISIVGLQDLVYNAFVGGRSTRQLFTFMLAVLLVYLIITAVSNVGLKWLEHRYSRGFERSTS